MGQCFIVRRGGVNGKKKPPEKWAFHQAYTTDGAFIVFESGWYRIFAVGKSGDGASGSGANGGGSGGTEGIACSLLYLKENEEVSITVNDTLSSFGSYLSATAGTTPTGQSGGSAGIAEGGNVSNESGYAGTSGGTGRTSAGGDNGSNGLNGGAKGGNRGGNYISNRPHAGGGAGGSRLPALSCPYVSGPYTDTYSGGSGGYAGDTHGSAGADATAYPEFVVGPTMVLYGSGSGGGGRSYNNDASGNGGARSKGTPGVVIIEKGAD